MLPHALFAWEMGDNFGHVSKIAEVARCMAGRARLTIVVRNPIALRQIAPDLECTLVAAPVAPPVIKTADMPSARNFPEGLGFSGWSSAETLAPLVEAWRSIFALTNPDVLVAQASLTAILAARGLNLPIVMFGSGFDAPPRAHPMPRFVYWEPEVAPSKEPQILAAANQVLERNGQPTLTRFNDVLDVDQYLLATFAEIDHYTPRTQFEDTPPPFMGQLFTTDTGRHIQWKASAKRRIFAYLRPGAHGFNATVQALSRLDRRTDVILSAPGATDELKRSLRQSPVRLIDSPVRLEGLLPDCDLGVSHASNGIAAAFVMAGVPQVGLPSQVEQMMVARAIALHRLGLGVLGRFGPDQAHEAITKALAGTHLRETAQSTAKRLTETLPQDPGAAIAERILELA
ncbi:MAG: glycosyltransferase [Paracoccaceae bacterium]